MVHDSEEGTDSGIPADPVSNAKESVKPPFPFHPIFFGTYAVLRLYAENLAVVPLHDLWRPLGFTLGGTLIIWLVAGLAFRDIRRGAMVASVLAASIFVAEPFMNAREVPQMVLGYAVLLMLACWKWKRTPTPFFNVTSVVLAALIAGQITYRLGRAYQTLAETSHQTGAVQANAATDRPDIFYIILDGYGRSDALKYFIGLDNSNFVDGLRKRGFYIADKGHSNYTQTEQSLSSSLNMNFLSELLSPQEPTDITRMSFDRMIDRNRVADLLRKQGYRYVTVTTGFDAVNPKSADVRYENNSTLSLFETTVLNATPFAQAPFIAGGQYQMRYERLLNAFDNLKKIARRSTLPRFVFVHILAPHPPFVFMADGSMRKKHSGPYGLWDGDAYMRVGGTIASYREGYGAQAEYVGKRILDDLDSILSAQKIKPIVIVQGDHGSRSRLDDQSLAGTDVREVFRNLNAYYVPDSIRAKLYPSITPVNSFRILLSQLFGEPLPNLPDKSFYSTWDNPQIYTEVSSEKIEAPLK